MPGDSSDNSYHVFYHPEGTLADFQAVADHYFDSTDAELYSLITSFNIIGQYANFDLLRQQEPDEAARLGVD